MLLNLLELKNKYLLNIKGVIHIGAHFGEENTVYDQLGIQNRIFFEPIKSNFIQLSNRLINTNYILVNKALGNENKQVEMHIESVNQGQSCSILKPELHLLQYPHIKFNDIEIVDMIKLNDFHYNMENYNFINIDVQGYEIQVFKGATNILKYIEYIMTEVNRAEVYQNCVKVEELDSFLQDYGFKRVETLWAGGSWGDAFYTKS